ncbi:hypothetical protein ACIRNI_03180 [Streptomyces sp. NPDC093546]|uniref:hypothetical protein n=1 Tax=Streptomyces sp. NPDC093546 TaxID=3366040 RepID=UPI0037FF9C0B
MNKDGRVVLVQIRGAAEGTTVVVVLEGQAGATAAPVPKLRHSWRLYALPLADVLVRALSGSAALALMHEAQQFRWSEVLDWLIS